MGPFLSVLPTLRTKGWSDSDDFIKISIVKVITAYIKGRIDSLYKYHGFSACFISIVDILST